jgi:hypothetical protein
VTIAQTPTPELEALAAQLRAVLEVTDPTTNARRSQHLRVQLGAVELVLRERSAQ